MKKIFLSITIIAKNNEKSIENLLKNIYQDVEEIIFVDTGSTDNTINIAKKYKVKLYHFKWIDNFAAAKNFALSKAKGKWILDLEADEVIKKDDLDKVKKIIVKSSVDIFKLKRIEIPVDYNNIEEEQIFNINTNLSDSYMNRLFKNNKGIFWWGVVHTFLISEKKCTSLQTKIKFYHFPDKSKYKDKVKYYRKLVFKNFTEANTWEQYESLFFLISLKKWNLVKKFIDKIPFIVKEYTQEFATLEKILKIEKKFIEAERISILLENKLITQDNIKEIKQRFSKQ